MSVELRPLGVRCNLHCDYCYQHPQRNAGNLGQGYRLVAMKAAARRAGGRFTLFGGEPLLLPMPELESLLAWGNDRFGGSAIQTNATLLTDAHIALFRKYRVRVGVSMDGPGRLNDARRAGTPTETRLATAKSEAAIERLCQADLPPSIIITLHRGNASDANLPALLAWVARLRDRGITEARLHLLESDDADVRSRLALRDTECLQALFGFLDLEQSLRPMRFDLFEEMRALLLGNDAGVSCVWRACDPYTTSAVRGVEGYGRSSNCGRIQKDGVDFLKADRRGSERYLALWSTPQDEGGCHGCRFFALCKGHCPGTAIDGDWRNRSEHCGVWLELFAHFEQEQLAQGRTPVSVEGTRQRREADLVEAWARETQGDFTRVLWTSERARAIWGPRLVRIGAAWSALERLSVSDGIRGCALLHVSPRQMPALVAACAQTGLSLRTLAKEWLPRDGYATTVALPNQGKQVYRVAIGLPTPLERLARAWQANQHAEVGRLLGYPDCCSDFFARVWADEHRLDPTWAMAGGHAEQSGVLCVDAPPQANLLLRWIGVRAVPHLPCSFGCAESIRLGSAMLASARAHGLAAEADSIEEMLSWPIEWSALHGIAEIKTPVLKLVTRTDVGVGPRTVRTQGTTYPAEGASGLGWLYRPPDQRCQDNGFPSETAMREAHRPILRAIGEHMDDTWTSVLDLGCGNGALLSSVRAMNPRLRSAGIDLDPSKIARARDAHPRFAHDFTVGDLCDAPDRWAAERFSATLLMPGRLLEAEPGRAARLRRWLAAHGGVLIVYAYGDWLARPGGLAALCGQAGLAMVGPNRAYVPRST